MQLKLSVIKDPDRVGVIVGNISRYANSQNKVNEAGLLAKDGFTEEELDFIVNYDIKYRMGQEAAEDDDV